MLAHGSGLSRSALDFFAPIAPPEARKRRKRNNLFRSF
jgi:hypothetical protein